MSSFSFFLFLLHVLFFINAQRPVKKATTTTAPRWWCISQTRQKIGEEETGPNIRERPRDTTLIFHPFHVSVHPFQLGTFLPSVFSLFFYHFHVVKSFFFLECFFSRNRNTKKRREEKKHNR